MMDSKAFCFNTTLFCFLIAGIACAVLGAISIVRGYKKNSEGVYNKEKVKRGWTLAVIGTILLAIFIPVLVIVLEQEAEYGSDFLAASILILFFFSPLIFIIAIGSLVFFLVIGINSLKEGFNKKTTGKVDVESIIIGFIMLVIGTVVLASQMMFIVTAIREFAESFHRSYNKSSTSSNAAALLNYLPLLFTK